MFIGIPMSVGLERGVGLSILSPFKGVQGLQQDDLSLKSPKGRRNCGARPQLGFAEGDWVVPASPSPNLTRTR
jgi:hypothetical protein